MAITRHWWVERGLGLAHVRGIDEVMKLAKAPEFLPQISNTDWTHARTGQGPRSSGVEFATVVRRSGALGVEMETSRICT